MRELLKAHHSELSPEELSDMEMFLGLFEKKKNYLLSVKKAYQDSAIFFTNIDEEVSR